MKTLKKLMAVSLTAALLMSLFVTAFAATIQITGEPEKYQANHEYRVYQIYTGTLSDGSLSNVKYGANFGNTGSAVPKSELDAIGSDGAAAREFANTLMASDGALLNGEPVATLNANNGFKAENLADGYYLIVDVANPLSDGDIISEYIVQVRGDTTISPKKDLVTSEKKITSDDHPKTEDPGQNPGVKSDGKVDNVSIGDTVNFTITNHIPDNAGSFDYFYFIINDTLSDGLTLSDGSFSVTYSDGAMTLAQDSANGYYLYTGDDANPYTFMVALDNAKALAGKDVVVTYSAVLNSDAKIGSDGNLNTENVKYSSNPNQDYDGSKDNNKPGLPKSDATVPFGETPDQTTKTYTSGIKIQKIDQDKMALNGASFTIEGDSINQVVKNVEVFEENASGDYWKLTSGAYTTQAPVTENTMKPYTGSDGYVVAAADDPAKDTDVTIGSTRYRVVNDGEAAQYELVLANSTLYDSVDTKYKKSTTQEVETTTSHVSQALPVNSDGTLELKGLGAGTYTIKETVVPDGYTKAEDVKVVITFDNTTEKFTATVNGTDVTADTTTNLFPVDIQNVAGNVLPATGGIGTKIFYALGAVLVIGAGVVLVSRKRALD